MGHHIDNNGYFQSDKYPELPRDKIIFSFTDKYARIALWVYSILTEDRELGKDIAIRLRSIKHSKIKAD